MQDDLTQSRWPKVIGVISLIYAIGGLLCATVGAVFMGFAGAIPEMFRGGVDFPGIVRAVDGGAAILNFCLGVLMVVGAVNLLRRHQSGVRLLKRWVILRMMLVVIGLGGIILTMPHRVDMVRQSIDFQNERLVQFDRAEDVKELTDEELWASAQMRNLLPPVIFVVYPVFLGFYLSRHRVKDEIREWE